jgi:hypothetical protein
LRLLLFLLLLLVLLLLLLLPFGRFRHTQSQPSSPTYQQLQRGPHTERCHRWLMPDVLGIASAKFEVLGAAGGDLSCIELQRLPAAAEYTAKFPSEPPALLAAACVCLFATRHRHMKRRLDVPHSILIPILTAIAAPASLISPKSTPLASITAAFSNPSYTKPVGADPATRLWRASRHTTLIKTEAAVARDLSSETQTRLRNFYHHGGFLVRILVLVGAPRGRTGPFYFLPGPLPWALYSTVSLIPPTTTIRLPLVGYGGSSWNQRSALNTLLQEAT